MVRASDYIIGRLEKEGVKHVFLVTGGGGMFLIDSVGRSEKIKYVPCHHEQACAMAAEAYSRVSPAHFGVALVTTGPAGTNAITGVGCAWTDSIPMMVLSGQAKTAHLIGNTGLRQMGFHEVSISKIVEPITKYAVTITDPNTVMYHLEKAIFLAKNGRPGPVWVDVPLDIQSANIDIEKCVQFDAKKEYPELFKKHDIKKEIKELMSLLKSSKRPVFLAGHAITLTQTQKEFLEIVEKLKIPVVTTRSTFDVVPHESPYYAGFAGNFGQRSANFTIQNSDLFVSVGSRLAVTLVGYEPQTFAREAKKVVVDIDKAQIDHCFLKIDLPFLCDVKDFLSELDEAIKGESFPDYGEWLKKIYHWQKIWPNVSDEMKNQKDYVSSYYFYEVLSEEMKKEDILVWDQGAAYHCAAVAFKIKPGQIAFSNEGFTPMGYGLPASVGTSFAAPGQEIVSINGDGGIMLNLQELQTVYHFKQPMKIFVFNNDGYVSIKHTQQNFFKGYFVGVDTASDLSCPDWERIAHGFKFPYMKIETHDNMRSIIRKALDMEGPVMVEVMLDPLQVIQPKVRSERLPDGRMVSKPHEDMYPYMDRELLKKEMIIKPID
jgi:acetolactate synthase-1/2/3 large subunit